MGHLKVFIPLLIAYFMASGILFIASGTIYYPLRFSMEFDLNRRANKFLRPSPSIEH